MNREVSVETGYIKAMDELCKSKLVEEHGLQKEQLESYFRVNIIKDLVENMTNIIQDLKQNEVRRIEKILIQDFEAILKSASSKKGYSRRIPCVTVEKKVKYIAIQIPLVGLMKSKTFNKVIKKALSSEDIYRMKEKFKVVLISPFSYGKSTLINALIGDELLNADVRAETANITKVVYGEKERALIKKEHGKPQEVVYKDVEDLLENLKEVTSVQEQGNEIYEVTIETKLNIHPDITIIDSPGLFSRYAHHNGLSKQALKQGDMIIFLIDPAHVGDANFSEFIKAYLTTLIEEKKDICFVVSKRDLYDISEERKILKETQVVLEELGIGDEDIYFVSAYMGLKSSLVLQGKEDMDFIRKDRNIFVEKDGEIIKGRGLQEKHLKEIWAYSQIDELKARIMKSKVLYSK